MDGVGLGGGQVLVVAGAGQQVGDHAGRLVLVHEVRAGEVQLHPLDVSDEVDLRLEGTGDGEVRLGQDRGYDLLDRCVGLSLLTLEGFVGGVRGFLLR